MQHVLIGFYILFFSTGFMGVAALTLLNMRLKSGALPLLLVFQSLFLVAMGLVVGYVYLEGLPEGITHGATITLQFMFALVNTGIWIAAALILRRVKAAPKRPSPRPGLFEILVGLVVLWTIVDLALILMPGFDASAFAVDAGAGPLDARALWAFTGQLLVALAMAAFGRGVRCPIRSDEPEAVRFLIRAYGIWALVFAPVGLIAFAVDAVATPWLPVVTLVRHLFPLALNVVSMSAAVRLFRPSESGAPLLHAVPIERRRALNLSAREAEIAVLISRGFANKQIAAELRISPATVRTHIYNLYRKVDARSRVELLNKLRG